MDGSGTNDTKAKIFRRELITALMFYFPVMIIIASILMPLGVPTEMILLLPLVILVLVAYVRTKYYYGINYKPNTKNLSALLMIATAMFLLEKILYSITVRFDFYGIVTFSATLIFAVVWFRLSKDRLDNKALAQMLIPISAFFTFIWFVFAVIVKAMYSFIVLLGWILLFLISLRQLIKSFGKE